MKRILIIALPLVLVACGGGGSSGGGDSGGDTGGGATPPTQAVLSGSLTYDFVPQAASGGLDFQATQRKPVAGVRVEAVADSGEVLATTTSTVAGAYELTVPTGRQLRIRALALRQQVASPGRPGWDVAVRDNTSSGEPVYGMQSTPFSVSTATARRDLHAPSGWTGSAYTEPRVAAPFAVLDGMRLAEQRVLQAAPDSVFPPLTVYWSELNTPSTDFRPALGEIRTTFFRGSSIYVLGDAAVDTDEYDLHVVVHEWGHYYERNFARLDSPGGAHLLTAALDPRLAFSEGWSNAWAAMVLDEPLYSDTGRPAVAGDTFRFSLESNQTALEGWFSQTTVGGLLWDIYDQSADGLDQLAEGFAPIDAVLRGPQRTTEALTTLFSFLAYFKQERPAVAPLLDAMAEARGVTSTGQDIWGSLETNSGGRTTALPVYLPLTVDGPEVNACTSAGPASSDIFNRLGTRRFLRVAIPAAGRYRFQSQGPVDSSPGLMHWNRGERTHSLTPVQSGLVVLELQLPAGEQVIEVYDLRNLSAPPVGQVCFDVSARRVQ